MAWTGINNMWLTYLLFDWASPHQKYEKKKNGYGIDCSKEPKGSQLPNVEEVRRLALGNDIIYAHI